MLLAEIMEYYTTAIDRSDHEMSISRLLMLSAAGLGLVNSPSRPDLGGEILIVPAPPSPTPISSSSANNGNFVVHLDHQHLIPSSHPSSRVDNSSQYLLLGYHHLCSPC